MKKVLLIIGLALCAALLHAPKASAQSVPDLIPPGVMPVDIEQYLLNCGYTNGAVAQIGWVSLRNSPTETVINLANTTTSAIDLQYNVAGIVCRASALGGLQTTTNGIIGSLPTTLNLNGNILTYGYTPVNGAYSTASPLPFTYNNGTPFTTSQDVSIAILEKRINTYGSSPYYRCVTNPGQVNPRSPRSSTDFDACGSIGAPVFTIRVNVPSAKIPIGTIDVATCESWSGWAFDEDSPSTSIMVHVYASVPGGSGTVFVGGYPANVSRGDVNAAYGITGNHGYSITVPDAYRTVGRTIYVYAIGINSSGSPDGNNAYLGAKAYDTSACPVSPSISCTIGNATIIAGGSTYVTVRITHGGPAGAGTATYNGTLSIQNQPNETFDGSIANGSVVDRRGVNRTYTVPRTYGVRASFTYSAGNVNGNFECTGNIIVSVPQPVISCDVTSASIEEGGTAAVAFTVRHAGPLYAPDVSFSATISITSQPSQVMTGTVRNSNATTLTSATRSYPNPGIYSVTVNVIGNGGSYVVSAQPCTGRVLVSSRPYVRAYANDVFAGATFNGNCSFRSSNIVTFNRGDGALYSGSGAQLGAFASGAISGFRTAATSPTSTMVPYALSFANTVSLNTGGNIFGGQLGASYCMPDYWSGGGGAIYSSVQNIDLSTLTSGSYYFRPQNVNTPIALGGMLPVGAKVILYIDGDVTLRPTSGARVGYGDGPWASIAAMPSLYVIAKGDIGVASSASVIDGNYVAQHPTDTSKGRITTCVNPATLRRYTDDANFVANCRSKLLINGSFSARHINLLRAANTARQAQPNEPAATSAAAEVFVFSLESYVGLQPSKATTQQTYDSITALPPIL